MPRRPSIWVSSRLLLAIAAGGLISCESPKREASPFPEIALTLVAEIGPDVHGGQIRTGGFAISPDGGLAVIDPAERRVVFVPMASGGPSTFGGRGSGPGEFMGPRLIAVTDDGTVAVYDRALRRLSYWDPVDGLLLEERVLLRSVWAMRGHGQGVLVKVGREGVGAEDGGFGILEIRPGSEEQLLFETGRGLPLEGSLSSGAELPQVCSICPFFRTSDGKWVFQPAGWQDQVVRVQDDAKVDFVWAGGRVPTPLTREEWLADRRRLHEEGRAMAEDLSPALAGVYPEFNSELSGTPPMRRLLSDRGAISVDDHGRLWTMPSLPPDSLPRLEIHADDGTSLWGVPLDALPVRFDVRGEWVAMVYEDDLGLSSVRILQVPHP